MAVASNTRAPALTPWFDGKFKPARPGIYQRDWGGSEPLYARWTGRHWNSSWSSMERAVSLSNSRSDEQRLPWRGLAEEPKS